MFITKAEVNELSIKICKNWILDSQFKILATILLGVICIHMVDFCRPVHICTYGTVHRHPIHLCSTCACSVRVDRAMSLSIEMCTMECAVRILPITSILRQFSDFHNTYRGLRVCPHIY